MASKEGQGQVSQQSAEDYWLECIKKWYPELHSRTYFLPPLHFNRVPYSAEKVAGEQVLVVQSPQDESSQTSSSVKSKSRTKPLTFLGRIVGLKGRHYQCNLKLPSLQDSDIRDDRAQERVLNCLRALADNNQQKEVMMVISQLQFGKYLGEPTYAAAVDLLPRPSTLAEHFLKQHYDEGDFDVLIIHRQHGLMALEIKSVGHNFSQQNMTTVKEDVTVMKKVGEAVKQLNKAGEVLKHLTSDLIFNINVTKILVMPSITSGQLLRASNRNPSEGKVLCQCLGVQSVDDAVKLCLLSDQLSDKRTPSDVNYNALDYLGLWWQHVVKASGSPPFITPTIYEHLVARFCGPATTVEVHCVTAPRLEIRTLGDVVSETGERVARLVLFPQQVELLNSSPPKVFLSGPPGTGKTVVLIMQGVSWLLRGHDVHVVSTWYQSRSATIVIEHQLQEMARTRATNSRVHRHQFDFMKDGERHQLHIGKIREVKSAVRRLESLSKGRQLCVIADEAVNNYSKKSFRKFCDQLSLQVPGVCLWGASVHHRVRPLCLIEVKFTTPLRSPPVVVREVMEAVEIKNKQVHDYTDSDVPVPTDGPEILRIKHSGGQSGHNGVRPRDCVQCGVQVAGILRDLNVGLTGKGNGPPPLQFRDVLVLCFGYPTDDRVDSQGRVAKRTEGLVQGLRACQVPVRVVEKDDEAAIRDTALGIGDMVTVIHWECVYGLERKVIVVEKRGGINISERLHAMSRCTSQLVLIQ